MNNDNKSLAHTMWNCKYHIVFAPKYRRKIFFGEKKAEIGKILRELCGWKGVNIIDFSGELFENGISHHETVIEDLQYMKDHSVNEWVAKKTIENTCKNCGELIYWMDKNAHKCK